MIGYVYTVDVIGLVGKLVGGFNTKTPALKADAPFPFPCFHTFLPPPLFFAPATQARSVPAIGAK